MSGSIFGDDDDFELVGGSDTPSAIRTPPPATPAARPVAPRTPSAPSSTSGENKNTSSRTLPAVPTQSSALPRPQLPMPTSKEVPVRRALPDKLETAKVPTRPAQERAENPKPAVREVTSRDTTESPRTNESRRTPTVVTPVNEPEQFDQRYVEERSAVPAPNRYDERENNAPISRRSTRDHAHDYDDYLPSENEGTASNLREESPKNLYSQTPYTPAETPRSPAPSRSEQPIQSYPDARTYPAAEPSRQEAQPETRNAKATRSTKVKKEKPEKPAKTKGAGSFSGGRAGVIIVRVFAIAVVAILMLAGGKAIFFPPQIPDPTTVTNVVKKRLGVTNFPTESGRAFVTSFAKLYLTVDPASQNSNEVYAPYMNSSLAANMTSSNGLESKQVVTEGPIISGVKSVDDSNAIYTVAARLNSAKNWVYVDVPVFYDSDNVGFAISGMPAFAPAPTKITAPPAGAPFEQDTKLAADIKTSVMEQFFPAWATSNTAGINLIVLEDANPEAKIGLANSVKFVSIQAFTVEQKPQDDPEETTRKAQATIVWASPTDPKITYTQQYNLVLFRQPDNRWHIKELISGVRS